MNTDLLSHLRMLEGFGPKGAGLSERLLCVLASWSAPQTTSFAASIVGAGFWETRKELRELAAMGFVSFERSLLRVRWSITPDGATAATGFQGLERLLGGSRS